MCHVSEPSSAPTELSPSGCVARNWVWTAAGSPAGSMGPRAEARLCGTCHSGSGPASLRLRLADIIAFRSASRRTRNRIPLAPGWWTIPNGNGHRLVGGESIPLSWLCNLPERPRRSNADSAADSVPRPHFVTSSYAGCGCRGRVRKRQSQDLEATRGLREGRCMLSEDRGKVERSRGRRRRFLLGRQRPGGHCRRSRGPWLAGRELLPFPRQEPQPVAAVPR